MNYPYECTNCLHSFDVIKSYREIDRVEQCSKCDSIAERRISLHQAIDKSSASDWNSKVYNPAFGKAVTPQEAKKEAKRKGWEEVGSEPAEKVQEHFNAQREEKQQARWDECNMNLGEVNGG